MSETCPLCGESGYSLASWDCGTTFDLKTEGHACLCHRLAAERQAREKAERERDEWQSLWRSETKRTDEARAACATAFRRGVDAAVHIVKLRTPKGHTIEPIDVDRWCRHLMDQEDNPGQPIIDRLTWAEAIVERAIPLLTAAAYASEPVAGAMKLAKEAAKGNR